MGTQAAPREKKQIEVRITARCEMVFDQVKKIPECEWKSYQKALAAEAAGDKNAKVTDEFGSRVSIEDWLRQTADVFLDSRDCEPIDPYEPYEDIEITKPKPKRVKS